MDKKTKTQKKIDAVSTHELIRLAKVNASNAIKAGKPGMAEELERLLALEKSLAEKDNPPHSPSQEEKSGKPTPCPTTKGDHEDEVGIPSHLRIKRKYTLTEAAIEQRRKAGIASRKNPLNPNWKHGRFAKSFIAGAIRPCKSTCAQYPCDLITEGGTKPGGPCLDKAAVIETYSAIIKAIQHKKFDDYQEIASLSIAQSIQTLNMLLEDIIRDGTTIKREKFDGRGNLIGTEYVHHPALNALPKMIADLGMTPGEMMITPKAISKQITEDEGVKTIADLMSKVGETLKRKDEMQKHG